MRPAILIVEDDPLMRRTLVRMLRPHALIVDLSSGEQALALIVTGKRFKAILCDVTLPGFSGIELFKRFRLLAPDQAERFVALTGGLLEKLDADLIRGLGGRVLLKPVATERLIEAVVAVMEQPRAAEELA